MAQRGSGYQRQEGESYFTPGWCARLLLNALPHPMRPRQFWEPAAGRGDISRELEAHGGRFVFSSDIAPHVKPLKLKSAIVKLDFLKANGLGGADSIAIITNPPYGVLGKQAEGFIRHALKVTEPGCGMVAMLLPHGFDAAKTRVDMFENHPAFASKITMLDRIRWTNLPQSTNKPSDNHAWYVWEWRPTLRAMMRPQMWLRGDGK